MGNIGLHTGEGQVFVSFTYIFVFIFQCGIGMAILLVLATNLLTRKTCEFLLKAGQLTRKTGYESLGKSEFILGLLIDTSQDQRS